MQSFRVLLVRLTLRLGQSTRGSIVQQVNYRQGSPLQTCLATAKYCHIVTPLPWGVRQTSKDMGVCFLRLLIMTIILSC